MNFIGHPLKHPKTMKKHILSAAFLSLFAAASMAQNLNTGYYNDGYFYRHEMNPALGNDTANYVSIPGIGNVNFSIQGNFGPGDVILKNPRYGNGSDKKLTTFMNPYISDKEALAGFAKGGNKINTEVKLSVLSIGFKGFGGYNTLEVNARAQEGLTVPYELFEFARNIGSRTYNIGNIGGNVQSFAEVALGHSHKVAENVTIGVKAKLLLGVEDVNLSVKNLKADLAADNKWTLSGDMHLDASMKGLTFKNKTEEYNNRPGTYKVIDEVDVDGAGIGGMGFAVDLGVDWKVNEDWRVSAAVLDLGAISWKNSLQASNMSKSFSFNGFHDIDTSDDDHPNSINKQGQDYGDQITDFLNLTDNGDKGSRSTGIGTTINAGVLYTLPVYRKLSFGLLGTARMRDDYGWTEARLSANWAPAKWFSGSASVAAGTFGTSVGWVVNLHPKGIGIFAGMDRTLGTLSKEGIPLRPNGSAHFGVNIIF